MESQSGYVEMIERLLRHHDGDHVRLEILSLNGDYRTVDVTVIYSVDHPYLKTRDGVIYPLGEWKVVRFS